jgi:signal transduction histidine kinase
MGAATVDAWTRAAGEKDDVSAPRDRRPPPTPDARHLERGRRGRRFRRELTPEERLLREAERRVRAKIGFIQHAVVYGSVLLFLALGARSITAVLVVGLGWGIGLASHFFSVLVAPRLRERWIRSEVEQQVHQNMSRERRALQDQKARSLEELSASIAHEIRNPITAAKSLVQQMGEDPASTENVQYASVALEELERVERSISHLLRYARDEELALGSMRLREALDGALGTLKDRITKLGVRIEIQDESDSGIHGDQEKLRRVFINLIGNALDAFEQAGTAQPQIDIALGRSLAGNELWVRIRDNGPGMDDATRERAFHPFFTSKANGTGLGLAISRKLIDAHGGAIELSSAPKSGTEFVVTLPRGAGSPA